MDIIEQILYAIPIILMIAGAFYLSINRILKDDYEYEFDEDDRKRKQRETQRKQNMYIDG